MTTFIFSTSQTVIFLDHDKILDVIPLLCHVIKAAVAYIVTYHVVQIDTTRFNVPCYDVNFYALALPYRACHDSKYIKLCLSIYSASMGYILRCRAICEERKTVKQ